MSHKKQGGIQRRENKDELYKGGAAKISSAKMANLQYIISKSYITYLSV